MTATTQPNHAEYCLPRPGEDAPRIETYRSPKYAQDGITPAGSVLTVRCVECGNATYDGVQRTA
jgi:hypothetical protein